MSDKESNNEHVITLRTRVLLRIQVVIVFLALIITVVGIYNSFTSPLRLVVYICQAIACISIIIYAILHFHNTKAEHFKRVIYSYAMLEVMRCALLGTTGTPLWAGIAARALLATLACNCVYFAQNLESKKSVYISMAVVSLETLLYLVFFLGFPGMRESVLLTLLPLVGVFLAFSMFLFNIVRLGKKID